MGSIASAVPSICSARGDIVPVMSGRLSRASSSSSSGCLSDENNGFDSEFPTGTIKRKPSMKPNLPLTSMTRQLVKDVGDAARLADASPTSPERGGTLTRRPSRRRTDESSLNGTLKRRTTISNRGSIESMSSNASTPTPTPTPTPGTPLTNGPIFSEKPMSPLQTMPSCMTDSTFSLPPPPDDLGTEFSGSTLSLDSLPLPPPPMELDSNFSGSQLSLVNSQLPPPPPPIQPEVVEEVSQKTIENVMPPPAPPAPILKYNSNSLPAPLVNGTGKIKVEAIYSSKTMKPSALKAPPYKPPPAYNGTPPPATPPAQSKSVSFAESPVLLRRKVCFEDEVQEVPISPRKTQRDVYSAPPVPVRSEGTRLSNFTAPKRLSESPSNPPRDFLKDLQRVMRKKWQVAQKCKSEPATTPHEVLGFRDLPYNEESSSHYYRETANVSHWVQEHYGSDSLYENLGKNLGAEPVFQSPISIKKRPPPPPPKRSEKTQLTTAGSGVVYRKEV